MSRPTCGNDRGKTSSPLITGSSVRIYTDPSRSRSGGVVFNPTVKGLGNYNHWTVKVHFDQRSRRLLFIIDRTLDKPST